MTKKIDVVIVEDHNDALTYIYRAIGAKKIPFSGLKLLHFDAHPDLGLPDIESSIYKTAPYDVLSKLSIEDWILPAVFGGHIDHVVWMHPEWSKQLKNRKSTFYHVGINKFTDRLAVDIPEPYFYNDCLYACLNELESAKRFGLTVSTIHEANTLCKVCIDVIGVVHNSPFILDIDLDTLSTCNPFRDMYTSEQLELIDKLYTPIKLLDHDLMHLLPDLSNYLHSQSTVCSSARSFQNFPYRQHHLSLVNQKAHYNVLTKSTYLPPYVIGTQGIDTQAPLSIARNEALLIVTQAQALACLATRVRRAQLDILLTWVIALETTVLPDLESSASGHCDYPAITAFLKTTGCQAISSSLDSESSYADKLLGTVGKHISAPRDGVQDGDFAKITYNENDMQADLWEPEEGVGDYDNECFLSRVPPELLDLCRLVVSFSKFSSTALHTPATSSTLPNTPTELPTPQALALARRILDEADQLMSAARRPKVEESLGKITENSSIPLGGEDFLGCDTFRRSTLLTKGLGASDQPSVSPMKRRSSSPSASHGLGKARLRPTRCYLGDNRSTRPYSAVIISPNFIPPQQVPPCSDSLSSSDTNKETATAASDLTMMEDSPLRDSPANESCGIATDGGVLCSSCIEHPRAKDEPHPLCHKNPCEGSQNQWSTQYRTQFEEVITGEPMEIILGNSNLLKLSPIDEAEPKGLRKINQKSDDENVRLDNIGILTVENQRGPKSHVLTSYSQMELNIPLSSQISTNSAPMCAAVTGDKAVSFAEMESDRAETMRYLHRLWITMADQETDPLPHYETTSREQQQLCEDMESVLNRLHNPCYITIARSSADGYTPSDKVDNLQLGMLKALDRIYGRNSLNITLAYDNCSTDAELLRALGYEVKLPSKLRCFSTQAGGSTFSNRACPDVSGLHTRTSRPESSAGEYRTEPGRKDIV